MADEENVAPAVDTPPAPPVEETPPAPPADDVPPAPPADDVPPVQEKGEEIATPVLGDACTCPDGRAGTVSAGSEEGTLICLPNGN